MLDNLKLGYGGTKSEMERLIQDANRLREANGKAGDLSIDKFSDVVEAIHEVQTEMGITGTTAEEAAHTIEGSIGSMQAAWENWLTGLANPNADMNKLTAELAESFMHVVENVAPAVGRMVTSIAQLLADGLRNGFNTAMEGLGLDFRMPEIDVGAAFGDFFAQLQEVGGMIQSTLGEAAQAAAPLVQGLVEAFQSFADGAVPLVEGAVTVIGEFFSGLVEKIGGVGEFLAPAMEAMGEFWSTIGTIVGEGMAMLGEAFGNADVSGAIEFLGATLNVLRDAFVVVTDTVTAFLEGVWNGFQAAMADPMVQDAIAALQEAFNGLMGALGALMEALSPIISFLGEILPPIFSVLGEIIGSLFGILVGVFSGIVAGVTNIITVVTEVVTAIVGFFTGTLPGAINGFFAGVQNFFNGVIGIISGIIGAVTGAVGNVINAIGSCISNIIGAIAGAVGGIIGAAISFFGGFVDGVRQQGENALNFVSSIPDQIIGFISGIDLFGAASNIMDGFLNGLKSAWGAVQDFVGGIADWIASHKGPVTKDKRLLVPAGKAIMTGLSRGLRDAFASDVMPLVEGMADELATAFDGDVAGRLSLAGATLGVQSASTVYSITLDGNTINDRAGIIDVSRDYLMELHRKGVM